MIGNDDTAAIEPLRDGEAPCNISGIYAPPAFGAEPELNPDPLTEWAQRALARAKELHGNEALRREVAKRSF